MCVCRLIYTLSFLKQIITFFFFKSNPNYFYTFNNASKGCRPERDAFGYVFKATNLYELSWNHDTGSEKRRLSGVSYQCVQIPERGIQRRQDQALFSDDQ